MASAIRALVIWRTCRNLCARPARLRGPARSSTWRTCCGIWEHRFPADRATDGRAVTEAIWRDMLGFEGYLSHELLVDDDDPGHLVVVSQWVSREHADETLRCYADHPNARAADDLVSEPRRRIVASRAR